MACEVSNNNKLSSIQLGLVLLFVHVTHTSLFNLRYLYSRKLSPHFKYYIDLVLLVQSHCIVLIYIISIISLLLHVMGYVMYCIQK